MNTQPDYIEPSNEGRFKIVLFAIAAVGLMEVAKRTIAPAFMAHVHTLPICEQYDWLVTAIFATIWTTTLVVSAFMIRFSIKLLKFEQFPLEGAWVLRKTKIQRGRIVRVRAYIIIFLCLSMNIIPIWAVHLLLQSNPHQNCTRALARLL